MTAEPVVLSCRIVHAAAADLSQVLAVLLAVRELIARPENWTQGTGARDRNGDRVSTKSPHATCWCLMGAIAKVCANSHGFPTEVELRAIRYLELRGAVSDFNDKATHTQVLNLIDRAIDQVRRDMR